MFLTKFLLSFLFMFQSFALYEQLNYFLCGQLMKVKLYEIQIDILVFVAFFRIKYEIDVDVKGKYQNN